jgi:hypothetical protein
MKVFDVSGWPRLDHLPEVPKWLPRSDKAVALLPHLHAERIEAKGPLADSLVPRLLVTASLPKAMTGTNRQAVAPAEARAFITDTIIPAVEEVTAPNTIQEDLTRITRLDTVTDFDVGGRADIAPVLRALGRMAEAARDDATFTPDRAHPQTLMVGGRFGQQVIVYDKAEESKDRDYQTHPLRVEVRRHANFMSHSQMPTLAHWSDGSVDDLHRSAVDRFGLGIEFVPEAHWVDRVVSYCHRLNMSPTKTLQFVGWCMVVLMNGHPSPLSPNTDRENRKLAEDMGLRPTRGSTSYRLDFDTGRLVSQNLVHWGHRNPDIDAMLDTA